MAKLTASFCGRTRQELIDEFLKPLASGLGFQFIFDLDGPSLDIFVKCLNSGKQARINYYWWEDFEIEKIASLYRELAICSDEPYTVRKYIKD
jgi:hypothetical protein